MNLELREIPCKHLPKAYILIGLFAEPSDFALTYFHVTRFWWEEYCQDPGILRPEAKAIAPAPPSSPWYAQDWTPYEPIWIDGTNPDETRCDMITKSTGHRCQRKASMIARMINAPEICFRLCPHHYYRRSKQ